MPSPTYRLPPVTVEATYIELAETVDWSLNLYHVPPLWKQSRGQAVRVAVLDTGIDADHPDLNAAIENARDFTGSRSGPIDHNGHGTHVSGTIAAQQNDVGVIGVAPECRLLVAKVLGDDGAGSDEAIARGIAWAVEAGADILSMSFGSPQPSAAMHEALQHAVDQGRFVICAAGNDGRPESVNYPAKFPFSVAVSAVDRNGQLASFSSRGPEVDIAAPGQDILSTWLADGYAKLSGTSMATPFVSGVVALALARHRQSGSQTPLNNQSDLLAHLQRTATDAGPTGRDPNFGYGLINPESLLAMKDGPPASPPPTSPPTIPFPVVPPTDGVWIWIPGGKVGPGPTRPAA